jgi:TniQ
MINRVRLAQPAWHLTFPHRVVPRPDEWLPGVLLRCDEANHWGSKTTFSQILHPHHDISHKKLLTDMSHLVVPSVLRLDHLSELLAVSLRAIVATTYQSELVRIFSSSQSPSQHLGLSHSFRLCPECIAQHRMLSRTLVLLNITCCLEHQVMLQDRCTCGAALQVFHHRAQPFTCYKCGLHWERLAHRPADPSRVELEQKYLSFYEFFFTRGTPALLASARHLLLDDAEEKEEKVMTHDFIEKGSSLSMLIYLLVNGNYSPRDVMVYAGPLPWRSLKWLTFDCPVQTCPYNMHDE